MGSEMCIRDRVHVRRPKRIHSHALTAIRKSEHPARFAALYFADVVAGAIGGLMLYGLSSITTLGISGWRFSMLIVGSLTILIGIAFTWAIPMDAKSAWFLTPDEQVCAVQRVARERASGAHSEWKWDQFWATLKSPMVSISQDQGKLIAVLPVFLVALSRLHLHYLVFRNAGHQWLGIQPTHGGLVCLIVG